MTRMSPRWHWWGWRVVLAVALVLVGLWWWPLGQPAATVVYAGWSVWVVLGGVWERRAFRRGWHAGFVDGVLTISTTRELPDAVLRQMATGDPAPEPWDDHATGVRLYAHPDDNDGG